MRTPRWNSSLYVAPGNESTPAFAYRDPSYKLEIEYCLAETRDLSNACGVALSKPLLLIVLVSVLVKLIACVVAIYFLGSEELLVTPGDAIASFISRAGGTGDQSTFSTQRVAEGEFKTRKKNNAVYQQVGPRKWANWHLKVGANIFSKAWISTYSILVFGAVAAITCCAKQLVDGIPL